MPEEQWTRANLSVLGHDADDTVILFSSDTELQEFRNRVSSYGEGTPPGKKHPQYDALIGAIEDLRALSPTDRIGPILRSEGFESLDAFPLGNPFTLDVELWEVGNRHERMAEVDRLVQEIEAHQRGEVVDRYIGESFSAIRVIGAGVTFRWLLGLPLVRLIERPPVPDLGIADLLEATIEDIGTVLPPDDDAPLLAIIDSGVNNAHPILAPAVVNRVAVPQSLGVSDGFGHGSKVSGVAAYGDVRKCLEEQDFQSAVRLLSGKIVNDLGNFDDRTLVPSQMDRIVRDLHATGCRIFNLSLGDRMSVYTGGKVGMWTATVDLLSRELDVLFIVSAGNYEHEPAGGNPEHHLQGYPSYLLTEECRLFEPATAVNCLTVGAIAHSDAVPEPGLGDVALIPIAGAREPAPFTRCGPTVGKAIKPELCDEGGNLAFDGLTQGLRRTPECEILTVHHEYLQRLFTTARGTSFAAPLVAHKAALVLRAFPEASANLLRAFLINSAQIPLEAEARLQGLTDDIRTVCGYGVPDPIRAITSDTNRVVLYADTEIGMDKFFIYEVPIPQEFAQTKGTRQVRVTLAFDPQPATPERHILALKCRFD